MTKAIFIYSKSGEKIGKIVFGKEKKISTEVFDKNYHWLRRNINEVLENPEYLHIQNKMPFYELSVLMKDKNEDCLPLVIKRC